MQVVSNQQLAALLLEVRELLFEVRDKQAPNSEYKSDTVGSIELMKILNVGSRKSIHNKLAKLGIERIENVRSITVLRSELIRAGLKA